MKKLINSIRNKVNSVAVRIKCAIDNARAEGYVDSGVKILIAVVIGALLLAGLYALFNDTIMPTVTQKAKTSSTTRVDALDSLRGGAFGHRPGYPKI